MNTALSVLYIIICVALIAIVSIQKSKDRALGFLGGQQMDSFWEKTKSRTKEGRIVKVTILLSVLFFAGSIVLLILTKTPPQ